MTQVLFVGLGGFLGAICRYLLSLAINEQYTGKFPLATFSINLLAAILMGFLTALFANKFPNYQTQLLFLTTGILGALSTQSTLSLETVRLFESGQMLLSIGYAIGTVVCCGFGIIIGRWLATICCSLPFVVNRL